jgi:hypothetical protein
MSSPIGTMMLLWLLLVIPVASIEVFCQRQASQVAS